MIQTKFISSTQTGPRYQNLYAVDLFPNGMPIYPSTWSNTGNQFYYILCTYLISMNNYCYHDCLCNIYTIITLICIRSHICSFILRFSYFSIIHIFLYFYHACIYSIHIFIYAYHSSTCTHSCALSSFSYLYRS